MAITTASQVRFRLFGKARKHVLSSGADDHPRKRSDPAAGPVGQTELAYSFVRRAWGNGYATEAVQALVEWGVGKGLVRFVACVLDHNVGSQRVLDKIGLKRVGQRSTDEGTLVLYESDVLSPTREIRVVGG